MSPLVSYTTPEPDPSLVEICTTEGSTWLTTCSYCCCSAEAAPADALPEAGTVADGTLPDAGTVADGAADVVPPAVVPAPLGLELLHAVAAMMAAALATAASHRRRPPFTLTPIPGLLCGKTPSFPEYRAARVSRRAVRPGNSGPNRLGSGYLSRVKKVTLDR